MFLKYVYIFSHSSSSSEEINICDENFDEGSYVKILSFYLSLRLFGREFDRFGFFFERRILERETQIEFNFRIKNSPSWISHLKTFQFSLQHFYLSLEGLLGKRDTNTDFHRILDEQR